jgi:hypothetical protein
MALRVYMDVHVPSAISDGLRMRGVNVLTAQEDGYDKAVDEALLRRAPSLSRLLFTQDEDLLRIASACQQDGTHFEGVLYAHQLSAGIGTIVQDLAIVLNSAEELANRVTYLQLR